MKPTMKRPIDSKTLSAHVCRTTHTYKLDFVEKLYCETISLVSVDTRGIREPRSHCGAVPFRRCLYSNLILKIV